MLQGYVIMGSIVLAVSSVVELRNGIIGDYLTTYKKIHFEMSLSLLPKRQHIKRLHHARNTTSGIGNVNGNQRGPYACMLAPTPGQPQVHGLFCTTFLYIDTQTIIVL